MAVIHRIYVEKLGATAVGSFVGNLGDMFYDPSTLTLRISDGVTPGGRLLVGGTSTPTSAGDIVVTPAGSITTGTVQAALNELDAKKLGLTGGTLTGPLILDGTVPTDANAAVSRSFVETTIATTISSGGITGDNIVFNNTSSTLTSNNVQDAIVELSTTKLDLSGGTLTGPLSTNQTVFGPNDLVSASYLMSVINTEDTYIDTAGFNSGDGYLSLVNTDGTVINVPMDGRYLPLAGGTMTGPLIINATSNNANAVATNSYVSSYVDTVINAGGISSNTVVFTSNSSTLTSNTVQDAINELALEKVAKAGDTMTGPLVLSADPTLALQAATKQYVDAQISSGVTGVNSNTVVFTSNSSTLTSNTVQDAINELALEKVAKAGDTMTGLLTLSADPTANLHAATKQYVDAQISSGVNSNTVLFTSNNSNLTANTVQAAINELALDKVAIAGDTMTGYLTLYADPTAPRHAATKDYVDAKVTAGGGAKLLDDLLDVNASVPTDGTVLVWDGGISRYILQNRVKNTGDTMTGLLTLSGAPTANLHAATKLYVDTVATAAVAAVIDSAPATLDTLNELAAALGDDPNFATTVTNAIAGKVAKAGDTMTGPLVLPADPTLALQAATKQYVDGIATAANTAINTKVSKAGDTMTGLLTLSGDPTANLHAATKQYTDIAALTKVSKNGDTMTGLLTLSGDPTLLRHAATKQYVDVADATKVTKSGDTMTGALLLSGNPTANLQAATKQYVDTADATKVAKAGDTMTGLLTLSGAPTANLHAATKQYVDDSAIDIDFAITPPTTGVVAGDIWYNNELGNTGLWIYDGSDWLQSWQAADTSGFVAKAGDTMTGLLTLSGAPTANLHAATKLYVDSILPDGVADGQELYWDGTQWIAQMSTAMSLHGFTSDAAAETAMIATGIPMAGGRIYWNETTSKFRLYNGTAWSDVTPAASAGDVAGPASATDNAIARFDATTGKLIQSSSASLTDLGYLTTAGVIATEFVRNSGYYLSDVIAITNPASIDIRVKSYMTMTVNSAVTVGFTNTMTAFSAISFTIEINMTGGSITWPASVKWPGGTTPTFTVGKKHLVMFSTRDNGASYYASALTDYA